MNPRVTPHGRPSALAFAVLAFFATVVMLTGCSSRPQEILGPSRSSAGLVSSSEELPIEAFPPLPNAQYPRIHVWTDDGWRQFQRVGGVSLEPSRIYDLDTPEFRTVTFHWSMQPQGRSAGTRWALDKGDITDETPRIDPSDVTRWSAWSLTEASATVGPFVTGPDTMSSHYFSIEARDNLGLLSLLTVRIRVFPASVELPEPLLVKRR
jgi:hypothetical protein